MKIRNLSVLACLVLAMPAIGAEVEGAIGFGGLFVPTGVAGDDLSDATGINSGFVIVTAASGDFAGTVGSGATFSSFTFDPASTPVSPLWVVNSGGFTYSFDLLEVSVEFQTADTLFLSGTGTVNATGFDPTPVEWTFSGQHGDIFFAFSSITAVAPGDEDGDGVPDDIDVCPSTSIPETAPTSRRGLGKNRWTLDSLDGIFTQGPPQSGAVYSFTTADTRGCSCEQIIEAMGLGKGHRKHGCSTSALLDWINNP